MESTNDFVEKLHENQEKTEKNKKHQGDGNPHYKLPNKKHTTNK
ncbi:DUF4023 domain-containing protein [Metabacillus sp. RGM 3146]